MIHSMAHGTPTKYRMVPMPTVAASVELVQPNLMPAMTPDDVCALDFSDPETARRAAAYKVAGDPIFDVFEQNARILQVWTVFNRQVEKHVAEFKVAHATAQHGEENTVVVYSVGDYLHYAERIARNIGNKNLAFTYIGEPVVVRRRQSAYGRIRERDNDGNRTGNLLPVWTCEAEIMHQKDFMRATMEAVTLLKGDGIPLLPPADLTNLVGTYAGRYFKPISSIATHPVLWKGQLLFGDNIYHDESGLFLSTGHVEIEPFADPKTAYDLLRNDWLGDFPFASETDAVVAIAAAAS